MSKTDTVARVSLIFARKVHFSENSSFRENFRQRKPHIVEDHDATSLRGVLERGGALVQDHDDARALHCRRRAGPGRQHRTALP